MLIDTHAHIHFEEYQEDLDIIFDNARTSGIKAIITVGTDDSSSKNALEFCFHNQPKSIDLYASAGLHPHDAHLAADKLLGIKELAMDGGYGQKLVAIGECGLDYYKSYSGKRDQYSALEFQIELALQMGLPLIFHVRDAWDDFFAVLANYKGVRGVIHSFTGFPKQVEQANEYGLYFGINGIATFTKIDSQLDAYRIIPRDKLLLETDCPFLSPQPMRGKRNEPANLKYVASFLAKFLDQESAELQNRTSTNAKTLFGLK